jgi:hypothetical protein
MRNSKLQTWWTHFSHVRSHILTILGSREDNAWEYNENDRILIIDLHKLFAPVNYDNEKQMSDILAHVHLRVVDHVIIHAYVKSCTRNRYDGRSMTLYHPINRGCFSKLDDLVVIQLRTCLWVVHHMTTLITTTNRFVNIMLTFH